MKKRELIRRWGILFLSFMIMSGTASVPSYTVYAGEMDGLSTDGGEVAPEPEPEPDPAPEPDTPSVVDNGGTGDDGGDNGGGNNGNGEDNSGTGAGGSPAQ